MEEEEAVEEETEGEEAALRATSSGDNTCR